MFSSKASKHRLQKMYFCSKKLRFEHFLGNCKIRIASLTQLFFNLLDKLLHKKNCVKEAIFILQLQNNVQDTTFRSKNTFFRKPDSLCSQTFLSLKTLFLGNSKLVCKQTFTYFFSLYYPSLANTATPHFTLQPTELTYQAGQPPNFS